ncbi:hypothetical protein [Anaplasma phagocytophilum]|uniref:hypothetical protein n=1 Tax=Anaplasma phagocytophilum TaxID=948 RepID=UPI0004288B48|nr:hypothetical protein [Anaplasma phagocytophilum]
MSAIVQWWTFGYVPIKVGSAMRYMSLFSVIVSWQSIALLTHGNFASNLKA